MLAGSRFLRAITVAACVALSAATPASAAGWLEKSIYLIGPRYDGVLPPCEAGLGWIASRFAQKEGRFWNSDLQIVGLIRSGELPPGTRLPAERDLSKKLGVSRPVDRKSTRLNSSHRSLSRMPSSA